MSGLSQEEIQVIQLSSLKPTFPGREGLASSLTKITNSMGGGGGGGIPGSLPPPAPPPLPYSKAPPPRPPRKQEKYIYDGENLFHSDSNDFTGNQPFIMAISFCFFFLPPHYCHIQFSSGLWGI